MEPAGPSAGVLERRLVVSAVPAPVPTSDFQSGAPLTGCGARPRRSCHTAGVWVCHYLTGNRINGAIRAAASGVRQNMSLGNRPNRSGGGMIRRSVHSVPGRSEIEVFRLARDISDIPREKQPGRR